MPLPAMISHTPDQLVALLSGMLPAFTAKSVRPPGVAAEPFRIWGLDPATAKPYDLNAYLFRSKDRKADTFDDVAVLFYRDEGKRWKVLRQRVTTTPGADALAKPMRQAGTAIVATGYYRGAWKRGLHHQAYPALVQSRDNAFYGWRDPNKDGTLDMSGVVYNDLAGINWHGAGKPSSTYVGGWSAGCTVNKEWADHESKMALVAKQEAATGATTLSVGIVDIADFPALAFLLE